jgi:hypothetical protein
MIKYLITDYKKIRLYGDGLLEKDGVIYPFIGRAIMVKFLGLWWVCYKCYYTKPNYF